MNNKNNVKNEEITVDLSKNPALNYKQYTGIIENLKENSNDESMVTIINAFIVDLMNYNKEGYIKKIKNVSIKGLNPKTVKSLIDYMKIKRKEFQQKEAKAKKQGEDENQASTWKGIEEAIDKAALEGKQGSKKEIVQRLIADIDSGNFEYEFKNKEKKFVIKNLKRIVSEIEEEEKQEEEAKIKKEEAAKKTEAEKRNAKVIAGKAMEQIQDIVKREYQAGNIKNKATYLAVIRDSITGESAESDLNIKIGKTAQKYLIEMIDENIKVEEDELYFEQVKRYTKDFQFLRDDFLVVKAIHGASKINKFTDSEARRKYNRLRELVLVQKGYNEYEGIQCLLDGEGESEKLSDVDKRILLERKKVMDREIEIKRKSGGIR